MKLPDLEAWAVFAKVAQCGSFSGAATELGLSKATISKAVGRLENRLGATLLHRTSRRLSLTEAGRATLDRASRLLAEGEALEADALAQSQTPRGLVRMAAPMSFGVAFLAPALPEFFALHPEVSVEFSLSDRIVDIVDAGYDLALRISELEDSSLRARRLCSARVLLVGSPDYFRARGRPQHPDELTTHSALIYTNTRPRDVWRFDHPVEGRRSVQVSGPLRADNADFLHPALLGGLGLARAPDFLVWKDISEGRLEVVLPEWEGEAVGIHLVTPPSAIRPARVEVLIDFLARRLTAAPWAKAA